MYYLFKYHNIKPMEFMKMGEGEKQVIRAFMHYEIDQMNKESKSLQKGGFY